MFNITAMIKFSIFVDQIYIVTMKIIINGIKGKDFIIDEKDNLCKRLAMLIEGHCTIGVQASIQKYGYTEQRYYQLLKKYREGGARALLEKKPGSDKQPVRTRDTLNQIIRLRFLDPFASSDIIAQKLKQTGHRVSKRSVERTITEYGLQKKRMF
jgi:hypothetical protein